MFKFLLLVVLPVLASSESFIVEPEDEIIQKYKEARALLTPEMEEFLMELMAADDALIEAQTSRGIVDDILQALSGTGGNIRVNIIGGQAGQHQQQQQPAAPPSQSSPPLTLINPTFQLVSGASGQMPLSPPQPQVPGQNNPISPQQIAPEKVVYNVSDASTSSPSSLSPSPTSSSAATSATTQCPSCSSPPSRAEPIPLQQAPSSPFQFLGSLGNRTFQQTSSSAQSNSTTTTIGGSNNHLFSTISQVIMNSNRRNVTGIVDESLRIATPAPIREFVTGILQVVYCNGIRRLLGRC